MYHSISYLITLYHSISYHTSYYLILYIYIYMSIIPMITLVLFTCNLVDPSKAWWTPPPFQMPRCSMKGDGIISLEKPTWPNHQSTIGCNFVECKWEYSSTQKCESFLVVIVDVHLNLPIISSQNIPCSLLFRAWSMDFPSPSRRPPCGQSGVGTAAMRNLRQMPMI